MRADLQTAHALIEVGILTHKQQSACRTQEGAGCCLQPWCIFSPAMPRRNMQPRRKRPAIFGATGGAPRVRDLRKPEQQILPPYRTNVSVGSHPLRIVLLQIIVFLLNP
jgi:hypothetical protein